MNFLNKLYLNQLQNHFFLKGAALTGEQQEDLQMQMALAATAATAEQEGNMTPEQLTARRQEEARRRQAEEGRRRRQEEALRTRQERERRILEKQMLADPQVKRMVHELMVRIAGIMYYPKSLPDVSVADVRSLEASEGGAALANITDEPLRKLMQEIWRGIWNHHGLEYDMTPITRIR